MNKPAKKVITPKVQKEIPSGPIHFKGKRFHYGVILSIIAFCFLIYGNNISNGFSLDDEFVLHNDSIVAKGFKGIPKLFKLRYAWDQKGDYGYRPLVKVSFAIESQFFGDSPHAGHVINNFMYAFLCIFLFYFLRKLFYEQVSDYFLFVVIGIFICHPMHTEVVDSLKNRDILMSCLFGFYCTYAFLKTFETKGYLNKILWVFSALLAFDLGELCKPDNLIFIAITPLALYFYYRQSFKWAAISFVLIALGRVGLGIITHHVLPHQGYHRTFIYIEQPLLHTHWYQRIALGFYAIWFYVSKLIYPIQMICYYGYKKINPSPAWTDGGVIMGILCALTFLYVLYKNRKDRGILMFSLFFIGGTLFAYIDVLSVGPGILADRFSFLPSVTFAILVPVLLFYWLKLSVAQKPFGPKLQYLYTTLAIIGIAYCGRTIVRNPDWMSHLSVYRHDVKLAPNSAKLQSLTAAACVQELQENPGLSNDEKVSLYKEAEAAYLASINIYPEYTTSLNNEGMIQYNFYRDLPKAIEYFKRAISYDSNYTEALFNTGAAYQALNQKDLSETYFLLAIKANPKYYLSYVYLARLYLAEGQLDKILKFNQDAIDHGYTSDVVYVNMGNVYLTRKDTAKAVDYFQKAISKFSKNVYLSDFLRKYYYKRDPAKANYYNSVYQAAQQQRPVMNQR